MFGNINPMEKIQRTPDAAGGSGQEKKSQVAMTDVDTFYSAEFLKLHAEGKLTLSENRNGLVSIEDPALLDFAEKYKGRDWPLFLRMAVHPEIQKDWTPDAYNSIDRQYPRVFVFRQFSGETPSLFQSQDRLAGIPVDDLSVRSLSDTEENMFKRNRLTEGNIENYFFLNHIPPHKIIDLREFDLTLKTLGPAISRMPNGTEDFERMLSKSQFDDEAVDKMMKLVQEDEVLRNQIALLIINENSAIVLDSDYLIDIEAKKGSLKTESMGHAPISENITKANEFFLQKGAPGDVNVYLKGFLDAYDLYGTNFTALQKKALTPELVEFMENRNGLVFDDLFMSLRSLLAVLKEIPSEKLTKPQKKILEDSDTFLEEANKQLENSRKIYEEDGHLEWYNKMLPSMRLDVFREPLEKLITEIRASVS